MDYFLQFYRLIVDDDITHGLGHPKRFETVLRGKTGALHALLTWLDAHEGQSVLSNEVVP